MTLPVFRTLVVEDDSSWQQILCEILVDAGLLVDVATNLEDALLILKSVPHRLAIVDLSLAGGDHHNFDGLRILDGVRRLDPGCQTILLTGFATVELAVRVLTEYGAFTFLRKETFQRKQFSEMVNRALASVQASDRVIPRPDEAEISAILNSTKGFESRRYQVLVVEDDAGWRSILSELLTDYNHQVTLCASYGQALGYLRREKFVLAIIDLSLSGDVVWDNKASVSQMEGYELLTNTKSAGIPTIVVSGVGSVDEIKRVYSEHSIFAYLEKQSFDRNAFCRLVEEACSSDYAPSELECLTDREREVYDLLAKGKTNKEISEALFITTNTVKRHIQRIFDKLGVHNRSAATAKAISGMTRK